MGRINDTYRLADVICQHNRDGRIIPLKIRLRDDDGEYQTYLIQAYKDLTTYSSYNTPDKSNVFNHIWRFECKINVFNNIRIIKLSYNALENTWRIL